MKVVDMHCDAIVGIYKDRERGGRQSIPKNRLMPDLRKVQAEDYRLRDSALYANLKQTKGSPFEFCMEFLDTFYQEMEIHEDIIGTVRTYDDTHRNWKQGRMLAPLMVEEGGTCQGKTVFPWDLYRLRMRMIILTWNFSNELAFPDVRIEDMDGTSRVASDTERGFTNTGIASVEETEHLGMIIDILHLSGVDIWDVSRYTSKPFMAGYSNARAVVSHPRSLTDDMTRTPAERDGIMDINYCTVFLRDFGPGEEQLSRVPDMVEHMRHIRKTGNTSCIGLGSGFDGISGDLEMGDTGKLPMLADIMERKGFTASEIEAVFCKNMLRAYKDIL